MAKAKLSTSFINHNIRVALSLTVDEYIVMDILLDNYCQQPYNWSNAIYRNLGFDEQLWSEILESLIAKQMIYVAGESSIPIYIINNSYLAHFNVDGDWQEFWKIFREYGNEIAAKKNYNICRKQVDKETLHLAATNYLNYCDQNNSDSKYTLKAQIWLNPTAKRWQEKLKLNQSATATERKHDYL